MAPSILISENPVGRLNITPSSPSYISTFPECSAAGRLPVGPVVSGQVVRAVEHVVEAVLVVGALMGWGPLGIADSPYVREYTTPPRPWQVFLLVPFAQTEEAVARLTVGRLE